MKKSVLLKTGSIYLGLSIMTNIINFFITPVYTHNLTKDQFGAYSLIISYQGLFAIFASLGIFSGLKRFYNEYDDKETLKNTALTFSFAWGVVVICVGFIVSGPAAVILFKGVENSGSYFIIILANTAFSNVAAIYSAYYSMQYKAVRASMVEASRVVLLLVISYYMIVMNDFGVWGALVAHTIAYGIVASGLVVADAKRLRLKLETDRLAEMVKYGLGLGLDDVSDWVLTLLDRYFIGLVAGFSQVAIYSVGYKVGMMIMPLFVRPFASAFIPYKFDVYDKDGSAESFRQIFKYYNVAGWAFVFLISVFSSWIIGILAPASYHVSRNVVPLVAVSYLVHGSNEFYSLGLHVAKKSLLNSSISSLAAGLNVVLNILMIPRFGFMGAAYATFVSYLTLPVALNIAGRRHYNTGIGILSGIKYAVPFALVYAAYEMLGVWRFSTVKMFASNAALFGGYVALNMAFGFISQAQIKRAVLYVRGGLQRESEEEDAK